jgi:hypothetical protein
MRTLPFFFSLLFLSSVSLFAQTMDEYKVADYLQNVYTNSPDEVVPVIIILENQYDIAALDRQLTQQRASLQERSLAVNTQLQNHALLTQADLLQWLENEPGVIDGSIRPVWIANAVFADMKASALPALSRRQDVGFVDFDAPLELVGHSETFSMSMAAQPNGKEIGLSAIHAPALWAMGYTGYGRVAYCVDTGIEPDHPALIQQYNGFYVDPSEAWFQGNSNNTVPFDCDDHGTHVTGTMVGLDRLNNDTIGVAFNAKWVGAPAISCANGGSAIEALQWALNPDGNASTTDDMPDVINNSWISPGTQNECNSIFVNVLQSLETAGITVVFAAGNEGPGPSTVMPPNNISINLVNNFSVGAVNAGTSNLTVAGFSSRGPSDCGGGGSLEIKPEVAAPGVSVRSAVRGGGYANFQGTSMAAPHVSGAVLLLREAFPYLPGKDIKEALYYTCTDLGEPGEDNFYGQGIINVEEAFYYLIAEGNVPVDPQVDYDALLVHVDAGTVSCASEIVPTIIIENAGDQPLTAINIDYEAGGESNTFNWSGLLEPLERTTVTLPALSVNPGEYRLEVELNTASDQIDERPLNNRFEIDVEVLDRPYVDAYLAAAEGSAVCDGGGAVLRAQHEGEGEVTFQWYDVPEGGDPLAEGEVFETGPITEATTFYADAVYTRQVGMPIVPAEDLELSTSQASGHGLEFDALRPFRLVSVMVYVEQTGGRIIKVLNNQGNTIGTRPVNVGETGWVELPLNLNIPAGEDMELVLDIGNPFGHLESGMNFPYEVDEVAKINKANFPGGGAGFFRYYYFFDWKIQYDEICGRTPVEVPVSLVGINPDAGFTPSSIDLELIDGAADISFTDASSGGTQYFWDFGDGAVSFDQNPTHTYTTVGLYTVSQTVTSADGCIATALEDILVEATTTNVSTVTAPAPMTVFPNPTAGSLQVQWEQPLSTEVSYRIWNSAGQSVQMGILAPGQRTFVLPTATLPAGLYWLQAETMEGAQTVRFVKR